MVFNKSIKYGATMGCTSSTEQVVDPHTGQVKQKKKLGGQYPGQRRAQNAPYVPPDEVSIWCMHLRVVLASS